MGWCNLILQALNMLLTTRACSARMVGTRMRVTRAAAIPSSCGDHPRRRSGLEYRSNPFASKQLRKHKMGIDEWRADVAANRLATMGKRFRKCSCAPVGEEFSDV